MMETRGYHLAVGSFAIFLLMGLLAFVLWFSRVDFGDDKRTYMIHFKGSVNGLRINESVRFHGIPIGLVKKIFVDPEDISTVKVKVVIDKPNLIRQDSVASIEAQGLTGFTYVQIVGGSPMKPRLQALRGHKYPIITSKQSNIEAFFNSGPQILDRVYELAGRLNRLLNDENLDELGNSFKNLADLTTKISQGSFSLNQLFYKELHPVIKDIHKTVLSFQASVQAFQRMIDKNQKPLSVFTQHGLLEIQKLVIDLRQSNQKLQKIFDQVEASPLQFLKKSQPKGIPVP